MASLVRISVDSDDDEWPVVAQTVAMRASEGSGSAFLDDAPCRTGTPFT